MKAVENFVKQIHFHLMSSAMPKKRRYRTAIHEIGHAYACLTTPALAVSSVSTRIQHSGGMCSFYFDKIEKDSPNYVDRIFDLLIVDLAGVAIEQVFFRNYTHVGSSKDRENASYALSHRLTDAQRIQVRDRALELIRETPLYLEFRDTEDMSMNEQTLMCITYYNRLVFLRNKDKLRKVAKALYKKSFLDDKFLKDNLL